MTQGPHTFPDIDTVELNRQTEAVLKFKQAMSDLSEPAAKLLTLRWEHDLEELRRISMEKREELRRISMEEQVEKVLTTSGIWSLGLMILAVVLTWSITILLGSTITVWPYVVVTAFVIGATVLPAVLLIMTLRRDDE